MSTTDNLHKKVLSSNALKTNFISNTTQKIKEQEKRFSNISKDKEPLHEFRQTIHKNTTRYYDEVDMQGSATILPHKNSSRKNVYPNQNNHLQIQVPSNQRKQPQQLITNNLKPKSPLTKNRLNTISNVTLPDHFVNLHPNNITCITNNMVSANLSMMNNTAILQQVNSTSQPKPMLQMKNLTNKVGQILTDRQKSHRQARQQNPKENQMSKMKSIIMNNKKFSSQIEDLMCDQQMQLNLVPEKQNNRKLSSNFVPKNQSRIFTHKDQQTSENFSEYNTKTEKKVIADKPLLMLEKNKSEHTINAKDINLNFKQPLLRQQSKIHLPFVNYEEELRKFTHFQTELNMTAQIETIIRLQNRQKDYTVQPNYIEMRQKNFNWFMRAVLMDWMMHVCYEFGLKRETYYIAVAIADKYLQKTNDLPKSDFQLVGAASMFIAAKLQEFQALSSGDFSKSTDNRYSAAQIKQMQLRICRCMNYELNPPTLYMWTNRFMVHWDNYIDLTNAKFHPYFQSHKPKYFKKEAQQSYLLFRQMMQFIDCSILDVQTLQFAPKILVCSFMYLVLGKNYKEWPAKRIVEEFPRSSHYLVEEDEVCSFNHLFHMFLAESFEIDIIELLPAVQYCSTYFTLPLNFQPPSYALKNGQQEQSQLVLEQYESFQTYNGKMIDLIKKRYRGVYP